MQLTYSNKLVKVFLLILPKFPKDLREVMKFYIKLFVLKYILSGTAVNLNYPDDFPYQVRINLLFDATFLKFVSLISAKIKMKSQKNLEKNF